MDFMGRSNSRATITCAYRQSAPKGSYIANAEYIKQKKINELKGVLKKQQLNQATAGRAPLVPAAPWRRNIQRARRNAYITVCCAAHAVTHLLVGTWLFHGHS